VTVPAVPVVRDSSSAADGTALGVCLRLLTAAPRTRAQLEEALRRRKVPQPEVDAVLNRLAAARLIDDKEFARAWVESRHHGRGLGRRVLTAELRQRGVAEGDVRAAIGGLTQEQEIAAARGLVESRLAATRGRSTVSRTRSLVGLLARKGYSPALAYRVVREALEREGVDPADVGLDPDAMTDADALADGEALADPGSFADG
jgi:regulatory protein